MNAKECYDAVIKARNDQHQQVRERIFASITKAVQALELSVSFGGVLSKAMIQELTEAGFTVKCNSHRNETETTVSWDIP